MYYLAWYNQKLLQVLLHVYLLIHTFVNTRYLFGPGHCVCEAVPDALCSDVTLVCDVMMSLFTVLMLNVTCMGIIAKAVNMYHHLACTFACRY